MSKIAAISTVKSPPNELTRFVNYHLNIGINEIILFFDDPEDKAVSLFENKEHVSCVICSDDYWFRALNRKPDSIEERQIYNINRGVELAKEKQCNWVSHIDSDELIFNSTDYSIISQLEKLDADIARMAVREAIAEKKENGNIFQSKWFKKPVPVQKVETAEKYGCKNVIFRGEYFRGHLESKAFVKVGPKIKKYGIHYPMEYDPETNVKQIETLKLLHFDCVSFNAWKLKWGRRLDGSAFAKNMRKNRKIQFQEFEEAKKQGHEQLQLLYKKRHVVSKREKIVLLILGMIEKNNIHPKLFEQTLRLK